MGGGACYCLSTKQKLNGRSSTETELYGVHNTLPQMLWYRHFINAQAYKLIDVILYQDNLSAILLEKNGRMSSTKRTKHIDVRYYYVKDRVAAGDLRIEHCPTKEMWADYLSGSELFILVTTTTSSGCSKICQMVSIIEWIVVATTVDAR